MLTALKFYVNESCIIDHFGLGSQTEPLPYYNTGSVNDLAT